MLPEVDGVVHTLGTLIEDGGRYKQALREGDVAKIAKIVGSAISSVFGSKNPLEQGEEGSYEDLNRNSGMSLRIVIPPIF